MGWACGGGGKPARERSARNVGVSEASRGEMPSLD